MSEDKTIKLWDITTRTCLADLRGRDPVFSADGRTLAWTTDKTIKLWDVVNARELGNLCERGNTVHSLAFSPDGRELASGGDNGIVKLWNLTSGKERVTYQGNPNTSIWHLGYSPDGKTLAAVESIGIRLWDVTTGKDRPPLQADDWGVYCIAFNPAGTILASGGSSSVKLWDVATGKCTADFDAGCDGVDYVAFSPEGELLAVLGAAGSSIELWNVVDSRKIATYERTNRRPRPRLFRFLWDNCPGLYDQSSLSPKSVHFTPEGKLLAFGYDTGDHTTVKMWNGRK